MPSRGIEPAKDYSGLNRYEVSHFGEKVAVLGLGSYYQLGEEVVRMLKEEKGIDATLVNHWRTVCWTAALAKRLPVTMGLLK